MSAGGGGRTLSSSGARGPWAGPARRAPPHRRPRQAAPRGPRGGGALTVSCGFTTLPLSGSAGPREEGDEDAEEELLLALPLLPPAPPPLALFSCESSLMSLLM